MSAGLVLIVNEAINPRISATIAAPMATIGGTSRIQAAAAATTRVPRVMNPRTTTSSSVIARNAGRAGGAYDGESYMFCKCSGDGLGPAQPVAACCRDLLNTGFLLSIAASC